MSARPKSHPLHCPCPGCLYAAPGIARSPNTDPDYGAHYGDVYCGRCGVGFSGAADSCWCGAVSRVPDRACAVCGSHYRDGGAPCLCPSHTEAA